MSEENPLGDLSATHMVTLTGKEIELTLNALDYFYAILNTYEDVQRLECKLRRLIGKDE